MIGALSFIGILLVMGGVERNPGPDEKYIFRYQYLLIEVGTPVLRMVFDHIVDQDFKVYLDNNPDRKRDFNKLRSSRNKLTPVQLQLLPPIDNSPSSDKFDITLLTCLLRNVCGLCPSSDQVWIKPQPTDKRVEAYITRLKECRNDLAHIGSVLENETVLTTKWEKLCLILQELSNYCGFGNFEAEIKNAESVEIDEKLKEKYENYEKELQRKKVEERSEMGARASRVDLLKKSKCPLPDEDRDIQRRLLKTYQEDNFSSLPMCPLLGHDKGGLLELYEVPRMYVVNYYKVENQQNDKSSDKIKEVKTCSDLFHGKDKDYKNIYMTGDAGVGKTSFCKFLSLLWCKSKLGKNLEKVEMQEYIDYLDRFEFVFYVSLRDTHFTDLLAIIVNQLFYCENDDKWDIRYRIVYEILGNHDSFVIMDGLDEWTPKSTDKRSDGIPVRPISLKCVYLTTCRPYKIVNVRLSRTYLDHQVQMTGFGELEIESYVSNLINIINIKCNREITPKEFMEAVEEANLLDMLHIPMTTSHLVMLWLDRQLTSMSKVLIYGNIMDMLFKLAQIKGIDIQQSKPSVSKLPDRLSELTYFKDHFSQIEQLCLLSFKLLFEHDTDITSLVFTRDQLASEPYCLSEEETNIFCKIGILSKNKVNKMLGKQEIKLSFLYKHYLEFFAAIYVSTLDTINVLELFRQCRTINDVLKYENFLIFYAGLSIDNLLSLMTRIYSLISKDLELTRELSIFPTSHDTYNRKNQLVSLQSLILRCYNEGSFHVENSVPLEDFIFHDKLIDGETRCLRKLIVFNLKNVRLLWSDTGVYYDEFDNITGLKVLNISMHDNIYNREFIKLMKQNESLQSLSIDSSNQELPLPLEEFHGLTSLSLTNLKISPEVLHHIALFLSKNVQLKHKELKFEICTSRQ